eukprot:TRINITY_DN24549_c0_g1_i1.p1 TRINITY_DN24549_c0_g1~~TRINITY_DN24549_c0_g1_i1.p1  ORF type:complete len:404 (-),score=41.72 TRINITY_DN24549_c0_g1_i1:3-1214(-)
MMPKRKCLPLRVSLFTLICMPVVPRCWKYDRDDDVQGCVKRRGAFQNYGFLTRFNISEAEARSAVRQMFNDFGIVDFQFYDAFESYSTPFPAHLNSSSSWISKPSACFTDQPRLVKAAAIHAYIDEIKRLPVHGGGRPWLYVQAVAADEPASSLQGGKFDPYTLKNGTQITWTADKRCFYTYQLTSAWADRMVGLWGNAAKSFGFHGIHWDQLGRVSDDDGQNSKMASNLRIFLQRSHKRLWDEWRLRQTMNFVDGFGWHPSFYDSSSSHNVIQFPYWEVWADATEWIYWSMFNYSGEPLQQQGRPVIARYPDPSCCANPSGSSADDLMWARWNMAASACGRYLVLGDGNRRLMREYFPANAVLSDFEHAAMAYAAEHASKLCSRVATESVGSNTLSSSDELV